MNVRLQQTDGTARKSLGDCPPEIGQQLADNSQLLAAAGVHTPPATFDAATNVLVSPWVHGVSGRQLARRYRGYFNHCTSADAGTHRYFERSLQPLVQLHSTNPQDLGLAPLDPWRRIEPRLPKEDEECVDVELSWARQLYQTLRTNAVDLGIEQPTQGLVLVHGDFHVGQLVFGTLASEPWMVDLDDLALGMAESDLGNMIAHLVTSSDLMTGDVLARFRELRPILRQIYSKQSDRQVSASLIDFYGAAALLRRALKLRERRTRLPVTTEILAAAQALSSQLAS